MKLKKYTDKSNKRRKTILISIGVIVIISVTLLLYKTFAVFTENVEFPIINGKVDYFGNSDIYFAFYEGDQELDEMPSKDNEEDLAFAKGECDNGASIIWDNEEWGPLVKNLRNIKTKCSIYFQKREYLQYGEVSIPITASGDGLYKVNHNNLEQLGSEWNKIEYRYAGVNPNNYVSFNNEIWRIIGLVNVKTERGIEQRLKIVRTNGIGEQKDIGSYAWDRAEDYTNNWTTSKLKDMLNGIYYESKTGECFIGNNSNKAVQSTCDFNSGVTFSKGLNETAINMIDKEVIWNIGGSIIFNDATVKMFYERERGTSTGNSNLYPAEWSKATDVGEKYNGIGLIYPSDYGYATNGGSLGREICFAKKMYNWNSEDDNYKNECGSKDWLKPSSGILWTLTPYSSTSGYTLYVTSTGYVSTDFVYHALWVWPVVYLNENVKIEENSNTNYGSLENPFRLITIP